jgi:hypothetical protein
MNNEKGTLEFIDVFIYHLSFLIHHFLCEVLRSGCR